MEFTYKLLDWKAITEIIILWIILYRIFLFLQGTKAEYLLRGLIILVAAFFIFQWTGFSVMSWLFTRFFAFFLVLVVVIFQPELREGLMRLGQRHFFYAEPKREEIENTLKEIVAASFSLTQKKRGALIAIKRKISLRDYIESGVILNADVSNELLQTIFFPLTLLHDGGVIIEGTRIVAAACLFPHTTDHALERTLGMRHRAAIGLSENSDAVVIVVSEENGTMSLAINGQLTQNLTSDDLLTILRGQLGKSNWG